ncbi:hypothetical protein BD770DRAFT_439399 [Pilaira anomala]|nr:hypothetical protein BD770DRAFT_439399 [Pilaira anomala]
MENYYRREQHGVQSYSHPNSNHCCREQHGVQSYSHPNSNHCCREQHGVQSYSHPNSNHCCREQHGVQSYSHPNSNQCCREQHGVQSYSQINLELLLQRTPTGLIKGWLCDSLRTIEDINNWLNNIENSNQLVELNAKVANLRLIP